MGVTALFPHTPCRSGFPSGVRGTFHAFAPGDVPAEPDDWAARESAADPTATRTVSRYFTSASNEEPMCASRGSLTSEAQLTVERRPDTWRQPYLTALAPPGPPGPPGLPAAPFRKMPPFTVATGTNC